MDLQYDDYVIDPMLWCQACDAKSVVCINCKPDYEVVEPSAFQQEDPDFVFDEIYTHHFMRIEKVMTYAIWGWKWTQELAEKHLSEWLKLDEKERKWYAKKIGLAKETDIDEESITLSDERWAFAPVVDSINLYDLQKKNEGWDFRHDGIYIYCICSCDRCGTRKVSCYWGD